MFWEWYNSLLRFSIEIAATGFTAYSLFWLVAVSLGKRRHEGQASKPTGTQATSEDQESAWQASVMALRHDASGNQRLDDDRSPGQYSLLPQREDQGSGEMTTDCYACLIGMHG